jgi:hypothetical protein
MIHSHTLQPLEVSHGAKQAAATSARLPLSSPKGKAPPNARSARASYLSTKWCSCTMRPLYRSEGGSWCGLDVSAGPATRSSHLYACDGLTGWTYSASSGLTFKLSTQGLALRHSYHPESYESSGPVSEWFHDSLASRSLFHATYLTICQWFSSLTSRLLMIELHASNK